MSWGNELSSMPNEHYFCNKPRAKISILLDEFTDILTLLLMF